MLLGFSLLASTQLVFGASCWEATNIPVSGQLTVTPADCTTIPEGYGWLKMNPSHNYGSQDLFIKIPLNDSRVTNRYLDQTLTFSQWVPTFSNPNQQLLRPVIIASYSTGPFGTFQNNFLSAIPPEQGTPVHNSKVRLRHRSSENCIYGTPQDGGPVRNAWCHYAESDMNYILKYAGGHSYRLQQETSNKCVYVYDGHTKNWGCWNDLNMRFRLDPADGGFRLRHVNSQKCLLGNPFDDGLVNTASCTVDSSLVYHIDIIDY